MMYDPRLQIYCNSPFRLLSQALASHGGGADTPDNMILVSEADHAAITSAHAGFYGWRD